MGTNRSVVASSALIALAVVAEAMLVMVAQASPTNDEKPKNAVVFASAVKTQELFDILSYPARVSPRVSTTILAETDGIVSRIHAPLGQAVGRGQKVLTITHLDPVYQYEPMAVVAPVSGVVSLVDVTEGTQIAKGQRLAIVTDPSRLRIDVEVPALDLASLKRGMKGEFRFSGRDEVVPVRVRGLSPFVDPATGTATCELELDGKAPLKLAPGLLGQVSFKANVRRGVSIPDFAIVYKGEDTFVRLVEGGKAKQVPIKLGRKQRGIVEVVSGLKEGASLVERSSRYVADGEAVTVQTEGAGGAGAQGAGNGK